jgi:hypothetical protein
VREVIVVSIAVAALAVVLWIVAAYRDPGLRKAIIFSGFGMC